MADSAANVRIAAGAASAIMAAVELKHAAAATMGLRAHKNTAAIS